MYILFRWLVDWPHRHGMTTDVIIFLVIDHGDSQRHIVNHLLAMSGTADIHTPQHSLVCQNEVYLGVFRYPCGILIEMYITFSQNCDFALYRCSHLAIIWRKKWEKQAPWYVETLLPQVSSFHHACFLKNIHIFCSLFLRMSTETAELLKFALSKTKLY